MSDNLPHAFSPEVILLGVEFADDYQAITVSWVEQRNVAPRAWKKEAITFERSLVKPEEFEDVVDTLREWLDAGLRHIRTEGGTGG